MEAQRQAEGDGGLDWGGRSRVKQVDLSVGENEFIELVQGKEGDFGFGLRKGGGP